MALDPKIAEILDKLESLDSEIATDDEWKTRAEWGEAWGTSRWRSDMLVKRGIRAGLMEHGKRLRKLSNGTIRRVDCYRWVGEAKKNVG